MDREILVNKYEQGTVGLGILSWHGAASLAQALASYGREDFFSLFDDAMIFLPDPDADVLDVAGQYPLRIETHPKNAGILAGMEEIAKRMDTDYIFFTENDTPLVESRPEAKRQIEKALALLHTKQAIMARMRSVKNYGETFDIIDKYRRYFPEPDTLHARLRRTFRPLKAKRLCGAAIYGTAQPAERFPKYIKACGDGFYLVDTQVLAWTNQSIIIGRDFFLNTILPYCKSVPFKRGINGFRSIEIELNTSKFWTHSGWKIACGPGLLTHKRAGDRGY